MDVVKNIIRRGTIRRDCRSKANIGGLLGTGIGGMAGLGAIGTMGNIPGMPANNVGQLASTGVNLALLGNVAKIGMNIIPRKKLKGKK